MVTVLVVLVALPLLALTATGSIFDSTTRAQTAPSATVPASPTSLPPVPCPVPVDGVLDMDASASIVSEAKKFPQLQAAVNASIDALRVGPDPVRESRLSLYQFSQQDAGHFLPRDNPLVLSDDPAALKAANMGQNPNNSGTDIEEAITRSTEQLVTQRSPGGRNRPNVQDIIVVFTDGVQNAPGNPILAGRAARAAGIRVIVVAMGNRAVRSVLEQIAGDPADVIEVDLDFTDMNDFLRRLLARTCPVTIPTPTLTPIGWEKTVTATPPGGGGTPTATVPGGGGTPSPTPNGGGGNGTPTPTPTNSPTFISIRYFTAARTEDGKLEVRWGTGVELNTFKMEVAFGYIGQSPRIVSRPVIPQGDNSDYIVVLDVVPRGDESLWLIETETDGDKIKYGPWLATWPRVAGEPFVAAWLPLVNCYEGCRAE